MYTSSDFLAGTDSRIDIEIYGTEGFMPRRGLSGSFEGGDIDTTTINWYYGKPYKIQISHDGSGAASSWKLSQVRTFV